MHRKIILGLYLATIAACNTSPADTNTPERTFGMGGGAPSDPTTIETTTESLSVMTLAQSIAMNKPADDQLHLRARIMFPDSAFEIYEPAPGRVVYSEIMQIGAASHRDVAANATSASDAWTKLMPGKAVPQDIKDVDSRTLANAKAEGPANRTKAPVRVGATHQAATYTADGVEKISSALAISCGTPPANSASCNHAWFKTNMCGTSAGPVGWAIHNNWCIYNWGGGFYAYDGPDDDNGYGATQACNGNLVFSLSSDYGGGSWTVTKGTARWATPGTSCARWCYPLCDWCGDQHIQYNISASGVTFDVCGAYGDSD